MRLSTWIAAPLLAGLWAAGIGPAAAVDVDISASTIERALRLAREPEPVRSRFHDRYAVAVRSPRADGTIVDRLEVVTEFRRVVLAAEARVRFGDHLSRVRDAEEWLQPWRGRLSIVAYLRFHPQHAYVSLPPFDLMIRGAANRPVVAPLDVRRLPLYSLPGPPVSGLTAPGSQATGSPLLGAVVESIFPAPPLATSTRDVAVVAFPHEIARATIDFGALE